MQFQRRRRQAENINLTPLIDVVFLLLIFFMVSTTFVRESNIALELPRADSGTPPQHAALEIRVARDGSFAVNGRVLLTNDGDSLMKALREVAAGDYEQPVTIRADARSSHQDVVTAMDSARRLRLHSLRLVTVTEGGAAPDDGR